MASASVADNLDAAQRELNVRRVWGKQLFAGLTAETPVHELQSGITERHVCLLRHVGDERRKLKFFHFLRVLPRCEPARFPVVAIIRQTQFRSDEKDLAVQDKYPAVVPHPTVNYRHADITQDVVGVVPGKELREALP